MVFSSQVFIFLFLPIVLFFYYIIRRKYRNNFLTLASLIFFAWGGVSYTLILIISILVNYGVGLLIDKTKGTSKAKAVLSIGVTINLGIIGFYKYANFIIDNLNELFGFLELALIDNKSIILPIGISFYTFQAISYLVDVYRDETPVQKNLAYLGLYIALFPQLIAGPIVRYHDINKQLTGRKESIHKFSSGVSRFIIGLVKKVIIANTMAEIADSIFVEDPAMMSSLTAWIGIIAYSLQIYFDFSAYSDMAIGLGRMFGFSLLENFNLPYIAKSIQEFWRRWHISLSNWFRDYLYIPLGGNRVNKSRVYFNLFIVFLLTGLWHGASWNFIIWGLFHGLFLIIERLGFSKVLANIGRPFNHIYTLFVVLIGWVFFRADDFGYAIKYIYAMFGGGATESASWMYNEFFHNEVTYIFYLALIGASGFFMGIPKIAEKFLPLKNRGIVLYSIQLVKPMSLLILFLLALMKLATDSYNPFIYFRF